MVAALAPWSSPARVLNFAEVVDARAAFAPEACARLSAVRDVYDPRRVMVAAHEL